MENMVTFWARDALAGSGPEPPPGSSPLRKGQSDGLHARWGVGPLGDRPQLDFLSPGLTPLASCCGRGW